MSWAIRCDICGKYEDLLSSPFTRCVPETDAVRLLIGEVESTYCTCRVCSTRIKNFIDAMASDTFTPDPVSSESVENSRCWLHKIFKKEK